MKPYHTLPMSRCLAGIAGEDYQEPFLPPVVLPKLPSRLYVRFGQPFSLKEVNKKDRVKCQEIYENVKVRNCILNAKSCRTYTVARLCVCL